MTGVMASEAGAQILNEFTAAQWTKLSKAEQIAKCREFAAEAEKLAQFVHPQLRQPYNDIARQWLHLADEIGQVRENSD